MIVLFGIPSEPPLELIRRRLAERRVPAVMLNQREFESVELRCRVVDGSVEGSLRIGSAIHGLGDVGAVYARPMDDRLLPELDHEPADSPRRARCRGLHEALVGWLDTTPALVINRFREMGSNGSKPYQSQLIARAGLRVPETLVTDDPAAVAEFREHHGRVVYKSISATRSVVRELGDDDAGRLTAIRACPVQFQAYVPGFDVRVHVIADDDEGDDVISTRVDSPAIDYRYSEHGEAGTRLTAFELPADVAALCRAVTRALGLTFAGIDLRFTPDGEAVCFEVNPSPAYSYYEEHAGQPISELLARHLASRVPARRRTAPSASRAVAV